MADLALSCQCGKVTGTAINVTPKNGNRVVCCCRACQEFAEHLKSAKQTLDEFGGTEIYQTSQSQVKIETGAEHLRCLRLTRKGLARWYTDCCNTPVGNTQNANVPFIGVIHSFWKDDGQRDQLLGPVIAYVQTQYAKGNPTHPKAAAKYPLGITLNIIRKMLTWKLTGKGKPTAFFADGKPIVKPLIVNP